MGIFGKKEKKVRELTAKEKLIDGTLSKLENASLDGFTRKDSTYVGKVGQAEVSFQVEFRIVMKAWQLEIKVLNQEGKEIQRLWTTDDSYVQRGRSLSTKIERHLQGVASNLMEL